MNNTEEKINSAIKEVFEEISSLSDEEFFKELEECKEDSFTYLLLHADFVELE